MLSTHYSQLTEGQKKLAMGHLDRLGRKEDVTKSWRCLGLNGEACVFGLAASGGPAKWRMGKTCIFCDQDGLEEKCKTKAGKTEFGQHAVCAWEKNPGRRRLRSACRPASKR